MERDRRIARPAVAVAEELAAEPAAGRKRVADPRPEVIELLRWTERQREARVDEVAWRQGDVLERSDLRLQPLAPPDGSAPPAEPFLLRVDGEDAPAAPQQLERVAAGAAAEVDGEA